MTEYLLPIRNIEASTIRSLCDAPNKRAFTLQKVGSNVTPSIKVVKSYPYKGRYRTYPKYENIALVPSYLQVEGRNVTGKFAGKSFKFSLPNGYSIGCDLNGVKIVRDKIKSHDLHLDSELVFLKPLQLTKIIRDSAKVRYEARVKFRTEKRQFVSVVNTTVVFGVDAARAGNCEAGILMFARRHGINPKLGVNASHLLKAASKEPSDTLRRVKSSIMAAHLRECEISI